MAAHCCHARPLGRKQAQRSGLFIANQTVWRCYRGCLDVRTPPRRAGRRERLLGWLSLAVGFLTLQLASVAPVARLRRFSDAIHSWLPPIMGGVNARFWVGGTGNWDASTTTHWAATTGGAGGASVPIAGDTVTFDANSGTSATVTITAATPSLGSITINKFDLTLTHSAGSNIAAAGTMTLTTGTLNTNGQACSWGFLSSSNTNTRSITLGASTLTLTGSGGNPITLSTTTGLTWSAASSTINFTGAGSSTLLFGAKTFGTMSVTVGSGSTVGFSQCTCATLTFTGPAAKLGIVSLTANPTVTGAVALNSNSAVNRLLIQSNTIATARTISAGSLTATGVVDFMDITGAGTATWTTAASGATGFGDCGGNSGITMTVAAAQTWSGNTTGNASTAANWTSRVPLAQDNVIVSGLTSGTLTQDMPRFGANLDFTSSSGGTYAPTVDYTVFGSVTLVSAITISGTNQITLGARTSKTLTSNTKAYPGAVVIQAPSGTYTLQDNFSVPTASLGVTFGTFDASNRNLTLSAWTVSGTGTKAVKMGTGTWTLSNAVVPVTFSGSGQTITPSTSTIVLSDTSASNKFFTGLAAGVVFGNISITGGGTGSVTFSGANTFAVMTIGAPKTVIFPASTTTTITGLSITGASSGTIVTFQSSTPGTKWTLACANLINVNWVSVTDSTASGSTPFYAGDNSTVSTSTGWVAATLFIRTTADSIGISDSAHVAGSRPRTAGDTIATSDACRRGGAHARTAGDHAITSDQATRASARARTAFDTVIASDSASRATARVRSAHDTVTLADAAARASTRSRITHDTVALSDLAARALTRSRTAHDTLSASDTASRAGAHARSSTDTIALGDSATRHAAAHRTTADHPAIADSISRAGARARTTHDSITTSDSTRRGITLQRRAGDTLGVADATSSTRHPSRRTADALALSWSSASFVTTHGVPATVTLTDVAVYAATLSDEALYQVTLSDQAAFSATLTDAAVYLLTLSDQAQTEVTLSDA